MTGNKLIKVCGMTDGENIRQTEELDVDMIGLIFYPKSPRYVKAPPSYLPYRSRRVGVFVDETEENIKAIARKYRLQYVQLHGNESPDECERLQRTAGVRIIKTIPVACEKDLDATRNYLGYCDYFLFDTKCRQYGGSGQPFDWHILEHYKGETPFLLSGGIGPDSVEALSKLDHPQLAGYDLNSRFELRPGIKDIELLKRFLSIINRK